MDTMGIEPEVARQILADELQMYFANRFRLTTRLRIYNRVGADEQMRTALQTELEALERIIAAYEAEIAQLSE